MNPDDREMWEFLSAAKGEPFTVQEWEQHVDLLMQQVEDAHLRLGEARRNGYALATRFRNAASH